MIDQVTPTPGILLDYSVSTHLKIVPDMDGSGINSRLHTTPGEDCGCQGQPELVTTEQHILCFLSPQFGNTQSSCVMAFL